MKPTNAPIKKTDYRTSLLPGANGPSSLIFGVFNEESSTYTRLTASRKTLE